MTVFRTIAALLPQLIILLDTGARHDLLSGFNRTDAGLGTLIFLLLLAPVIALAWTVAELIISVSSARRQGRRISLVMPGIALLFFLEAVAIDIYMIFNVKM